MIFIYLCVFPCVRSRVPCYDHPARCSTPSPMAYPAVRVRTLPKLPLPVRLRDAAYLLVGLPVRPVGHQAQSCAIALRSPASERSSDLTRISPEFHIKPYTTTYSTQYCLNHSLVHTRGARWTRGPGPGAHALSDTLPLAQTIVHRRNVQFSRKTVKYTKDSRTPSTTHKSQPPPHHVQTTFVHTLSKMATGQRKCNSAPVESAGSVSAWLRGCAMIVETLDTPPF